ncbi:thiamine phosphate synthase [Ancylobacter sp. A5.8]|uniref:thiamine phosphate synthase n=1 Tax=Ancylobacter gelatini TaxID=2919920 RepID=UPI001F4E44BD|nr:thiamine phosphate synthase [Ancylobacter gelatini]MCJ8144725.1 thiamine phosphate synthase [Ancylobacter gelatini]
MMARNQSPPPRPAPRLYLLARIDAATIPALTQALTTAMTALDVAAVLLRPVGDPPPAAALRPVVSACREAGAALLIEGNVALAEAIEADGAHLDDTDALKDALPALRPHGIAGVGGLRSKHDAMTAGELGADYVMFGEPDLAGRRPPFEITLERTDWWAQLFEPPCVAYARTLEEVETLVGVGADFIAVDDLAVGAAPDLLEALARHLAGGGGDA